MSSHRAASRIRLCRVDFIVLLLHRARVELSVWSGAMFVVPKTDKMTHLATAGFDSCPPTREAHDREVLVLQEKIVIKMQLSLWNEPNSTRL
jgi:hypothetical protein